MTIELVSYSLFEAEKIIIHRLLEEHPELTMTKKAEMLGITPATLYNKLYNLGIKFNTHHRGRPKKST